MESVSRSIGCLGNPCCNYHIVLHDTTQMQCELLHIYLENPFFPLIFLPASSLPFE